MATTYDSAVWDTEARSPEVDVVKVKNGRRKKKYRGKHAQEVRSIFKGVVRRINNNEN